MDNKTRICHLVGSIFYYGNFKVETPAEAELKKLLEEEGFFYTTEDQVLKGADDTN